jgi:hypothetical protein
MPGNRESRGLSIRSTAAVPNLGVLGASHRISLAGKTSDTAVQRGQGANLRWLVPGGHAAPAAVADLFVDTGLSDGTQAVVGHVGMQLQILWR